MAALFIVVANKWRRSFSVAAALGQVPQLYGDALPNQSALDEAVAKGGLVLREEPPTLYWKGRVHGANWLKHRMPWQFLWRLAEKAKRGHSFEDRDLYGDRLVSFSTFPTVFNRLKKLVPPTLFKEIVPGEMPRTYRLRLDPGQIYLEKRSTSA
jgi:hypothetical protein